MDTILSGYPEATSTPETIHRAMDYIRGSFRQQLARGKLLNDYQKKHPDLSGSNMPMTCLQAMLIR